MKRFICKGIKMSMQKPTQNQRRDCAKLIYLSAPHCFKFLTLSEEEKIYDFLELFLKHGKSPYTMDNIVVEECNGVVRGLLLACPLNEVESGTSNLKKYRKELFRLLGYNKYIRLCIIDMFDHHKNTINDEYFITAIAVFEEFRGQGIAYKLLKKSEELCREKGFKKLSLCVTTKNDRAHQIYTKFGFVDQKTMKFSKRREKKYGMFPFIKMRINLK